MRLNTYSDLAKDLIAHPSKNLVLAFQATVERRKHHSCFQYFQDGEWRRLSWLEAWDRVRELALGLQALGIEEGDRVAVLSSTRYEWTLADLAILSLGAVTVPIYPSSLPDQIGYILGNSGAKAIFLEDEKQLAKLKAFHGKLPDLEHRILFEKGKGGLDLVALAERARDGSEGRWEKRIAEIPSDQDVTIVYTSGTTGDPKGAVLSHSNFITEVSGFLQAFEIGPGDTALFFLPLAHIFARAVQFWHLTTGFEQTYGRGIDALAGDLKAVRPHFTASVPRIFEKFEEKILAAHHAAPKPKKMLLKAAPFLLSRKIRSLFGGRLRYAVSGGAPLAKELAEYFARHGILILEGYGLTETTAGICINTYKKYRFGTVGRTVPGTHVRIAADGEILVKSDLIFKGYYRNPEATRDAFTRDGWFKTGDIGEIDADGFLKITDRKKDLIVTAAGKNIAPQNIEGLFKTNPFIGHVVVHGDRRKYLSALVTLNREAVASWMRKRDLKLNGYASLGEHPEVKRLVRHAIEEKNKKLASYETIKTFAILDGDFTAEGGELTPTLKLKRKFVGEKYKDVLDQLYLSGANKV